MKKYKKDQKGFTIIEVLIVLAIAGLILLIVFLAVPALQRNSRNTQRRDQVANYLAAVNEFVNNNNGRVPTGADAATINGLASDGLMAEPAAANYGTGAATAAMNVNGPFQVRTGATCDTNPANTGDSVAGPNRSFVIRYSVEDSGGNAVEQCQGS